VGNNELRQRAVPPFTHRARRLQHQWKAQIPRSAKRLFERGRNDLPRYGDADLSCSVGDERLVAHLRDRLGIGPWKANRSQSRALAAEGQQRRVRHGNEHVDRAALNEARYVVDEFRWSAERVRDYVAPVRVA
jgi:hypothetical protein